MSVQSADVVVIGAGVIGSAIALELGRAGRQVLVLDRGPGPGYGSTGASSAIVRFNYSTWTGVVLSWEAQQAWDHWQDHLGISTTTPLATYHRTGALVLDSPDQDLAVVRALFDQVAVPYQMWSPADIRQHLPALSPERHYPPKAIDDEAFWQDADGELTGLWSPESGFVDDPSLAARNLMSSAQQHKVEYRFHAAVTAIRRRGTAVVGLTLEDGTAVNAPVVINAAGPHSGIVNDLADVLDDFTVTTRPLRQEVHELPAPVGYGLPGPVVADLDLGIYFRGTPSGHIVVGSTEPRCDPLDWLSDPDDYHPTPTRSVYEAQTYRAARRMPELRVPNTPRGIVGIYDVSTDWVPIYDRTCLDGFYVAIGTSGNQFKNAPVVGMLMHALIEACEAGQDHDQEPTRVRLPRTGHEIDLGHYSRRRTLNTTSGTVMG